MKEIIYKIKKCSKCQEIKSIETFYKRKDSKDGYSYWCIECDKKYSYQYYKTHKEQYRQYYIIYNKEIRNVRSREIYRENKIKAIDYLGNKCLDCSVEYNGKNICIFQFHHINTKEKECIIGELLRLLNWKKIKNELNKCELLCGNCHALRHDNYIEQE